MKATLKAIKRTTRLLRQLRKEIAIGLCLFCEEPLPPQKTKPRLICGSRWCIASYHRVYDSQRPGRGTRAEAG